MIRSVIGFLGLVSLANLFAAPIPSLVKDIASGAPSSSPSFLTEVDGLLLFTAFESTTERELWRSDGTETGTVLVKDILPFQAVDDGPYAFTVLNDVLYFTSDGSDLWRSDGTVLGTTLLKEFPFDPVTGPPGPMIEELTVVDGVLYFVVSDVFLGTTVELWKSDGTSLGTVLVKDFTPSAPEEAVYHYTGNFVSISGTTYFIRYSDTSGLNELWKTNGTEIGTTLVKDLSDEVGPMGDVAWITEIGGVLVFAVSSFFDDSSLWRSDGTEAGTVLLKNFEDGTIIASSGISVDREPLIAEVNGSLCFAVQRDSEPSLSLWKTNGTALGTSLVREVSSSFQVGISEFTPVGSELFFVVSENFGASLWKSDGTSTGTLLIRDFDLGAPTPTRVGELAEVGGVVFFAATVAGGFDSELWMSDGTFAGTVPVRDSISDPLLNPQGITPVGTKVFFTSEDPLTGRELYSFDWTGPGQPPNFISASMVTDEEEAKTETFSSLLVGVTDPEGDGFGISIAEGSSKQGGVVVLGSDSLTYFPPLGFSGPDSFQVTVSDDCGAWVEGVVNVTVNSATGAPNAVVTRRYLEANMNASSELEISFQGIAGRTYQLECSMDISDEENWQNMMTLMADLSGMVLYNAGLPADDVTHYRLTK